MAAGLESPLVSMVGWVAKLLGAAHTVPSVGLLPHFESCSVSRCPRSRRRRTWLRCHRQGGCPARRWEFRVVAETLGSLSWLTWMPSMRSDSSHYPPASSDSYLEWVVEVAHYYSNLSSSQPSSHEVGDSTVSGDNREKMWSRQRQASAGVIGVLRINHCHPPGDSKG